MSTAPSLPAAAPTSTLAGKYLTFVLGQESYGLAVLKIREIIRLPDITAVPQMPAHIRGVINLRGKIIPVVDLRARFGLPLTDPTDRTCVIVMQVTTAAGNSVPMGLVVDDVEEVVNLTADDIQETPDFGSQVETDYLLGMAKIKGVVKTLLDFDRVVTDIPTIDANSLPSLK